MGSDNELDPSEVFDETKAGNNMSMDLARHSQPTRRHMSRNMSVDSIESSFEESFALGESFTEEHKAELDRQKFNAMAMHRPNNLATVHDLEEEPEDEEQNSLTYTDDDDDEASIGIPDHGRDHTTGTVDSLVVSQSQLERSKSALNDIPQDLDMSMAITQLSLSPARKGKAPCSDMSGIGQQSTMALYRSCQHLTDPAAPAPKTRRGGRRKKTAVSVAS
jgi:hypothetical protein